MRVSQLDARPVLFHGNVITWARALATRSVRACTGLCVTTYPMFRGAHRVSRKRGRVPIGETLASTEPTSRNILHNPDLRFSRCHVRSRRKENNIFHVTRKCHAWPLTLLYSDIDIRAWSDVRISLISSASNFFQIATARLKRLLIDIWNNAAVWIRFGTPCRSLHSVGSSKIGLFGN